ncbi:MAG: hypothetical protein CBC43_003270 [Rhizobiales bacterium TMED83]|jgi:hypothetical protein|nr:hypothetical protein [Rhodobiaceae bacterium]RPF94012.1 MAG: hypothetical protein CBC43_003270 [Rhizobiales bacterium TMED83]|tara:strand:+ start:658 stop:1053 length:396 start_codon:yes stop_codon:yes gene_type:complete
MAIFTSTDTPFRVAPIPAGATAAAKQVALNSFANPVPTLQQTNVGIPPVGPMGMSRPSQGQVPERADADALRAVRVHPRQAPSTVLTETYLAARAGFLPAFQHNIAAVRLALTSSMHADMPRFSGQVDLLA